MVALRVGHSVLARRFITQDQVMQKMNYRQKTRMRVRILFGPEVTDETIRKVSKRS